MVWPLVEWMNVDAKLLSGLHLVLDLSTRIDEPDVQHLVVCFYTQDCTLGVSYPDDLSESLDGYLYLNT